MEFPEEPDYPEETGGFGFMRRHHFSFQAFLPVFLILLFFSFLPCSLAEQDPSASAEASASLEEEAETPVPAKAYVLVTTASRMGFLPLPEEDDVLFPLVQTLPDGRETENIIHLTPDGVYMDSSNCENQDCIGEGTVTLENRRNRILGNMIICLPNQVTLQLFTPE